VQITDVRLRQSHRVIPQESAFKGFPEVEFTWWLSTTLDVHIERFEFHCPVCKTKGVVTDVLLNPDLLILRGYCAACKLSGTYKAVDMAKLDNEYRALAEDKGSEWQYRVFKFRLE
jgi:hypothetical protein